MSINDYNYTSNKLWFGDLRSGACRARCLGQRMRRTSAYVSIRQHTSAYVSIRQHTSAYVSIRQHKDLRSGVCECAYVSIRQQTSAYVSKRQHTSVYVSIQTYVVEHVGHDVLGSECGRGSSAVEKARVYVKLRFAEAARARQLQHTSAYVSIRRHTSAYVSIRRHTSLSRKRHERVSCSIRQHTSVYVIIRQNASEYVGIRHCRASSASA
jgi:hypothetical protein